MERLLRPERLDLNEKAANAEEDYSHQLKTFENFLAATRVTSPDADSLQALVNYIMPKVYHHFAEQSFHQEKERYLCEEVPVNNIKQD